MQSMEVFSYLMKLRVGEGGPTVGIGLIQFLRHRRKTLRQKGKLDGDMSISVPDRDQIAEKAGDITPGLIKYLYDLIQGANNIALFVPPAYNTILTQIQTQLQQGEMVDTLQQRIEKLETENTRIPKLEQYIKQLIVEKERLLNQLEELAVQSGERIHALQAELDSLKASSHTPEAHTIHNHNHNHYNNNTYNYNSYYTADIRTVHRPTPTGARTTSNNGMNSPCAKQWHSVPPSERESVLMEELLAYKPSRRWYRFVGRDSDRCGLLQQLRNSYVWTTRYENTTDNVVVSLVGESRTGMFYVNGPRGSGKAHLVDEVLKEMEPTFTQYNAKLAPVIIDCSTDVKRMTGNMCKVIFSTTGTVPTGFTYKNASQCVPVLKQRILTLTEPLIVVLKCVDNLHNSDLLTVLYGLVALKGSKLIVLCTGCLTLEAAKLDAKSMEKKLLLYGAFKGDNISIDMVVGNIKVTPYSVESMCAIAQSRLMGTMVADDTKNDALEHIADEAMVLFQQKRYSEGALSLMFKIARAIVAESAMLLDCDHRGHLLTADVVNKHIASVRAMIQQPAVGPVSSAALAPSATVYVVDDSQARKRVAEDAHIVDGTYLFGRGQRAQDKHSRRQGRFVDVAGVHDVHAKLVVRDTRPYLLNCSNDDMVLLDGRKLVKDCEGTLVPHDSRITIVGTSSSAQFKVGVNALPTSSTLAAAPKEDILFVGTRSLLCSTPVATGKASTVQFSSHVVADFNNWRTVGLPSVYKHHFSSILRRFSVNVCVRDSTWGVEVKFLAADHPIFFLPAYSFVNADPDVVFGLFPYVKPLDKSEQVFITFCEAPIDIDGQLVFPAQTRFKKLKFLEVPGFQFDKPQLTRDDPNCNIDPKCGGRLFKRTAK